MWEEKNMEWGRILAAALPATGENVSIWPFVLLGVGILLIAALVVLQIASKKKGGPKSGPSGPDQQPPEEPEQK